MRRIIGTMTRIAAVVLSLAIASFALAQSPDLKVTIEHPPSMRLGDVATLTATVENAGSVTAIAPSVDLRIIPGLDCDRRIFLGPLPAGEKRTVSCTQQVLDFGLYYLEFRAAARATNEHLSLLDNNFVNAFVPRLTAGTDLALHLTTLPVATKPGLPFPFRVLFENRSFTPATNAILTFTLSEGSFGPNLPPSCSVEEMRAVCHLGTLDATIFEGRFALPFVIDVIAPDRSEAQWSIDVVLRVDQSDEKPADNVQRAHLVNYRTFYVREATDAALRGALNAAGDSCQGFPCLVAFRIPNGNAPSWHTIKLEQPLDLLRARTLEIDGTTQAGYYGDTNPHGPEIEIDGSATAGDGFSIPSRCGITLRGLVLNGFNGAAVHAHDGPFSCVDSLATTVRDNYIGTDPTGRSARPNERGILSTSAYGLSALGNVISGNRRSAVHMSRGRGLIANNVIGLDATHDAPLPNGASGVYIDADADGTDVNDNYIGFNAHFGVAIQRGAEHVALHGNSFQANGGLAIDWGLDGPDVIGTRVRTPSIRSVRYANGVTTIEVDAQPASSFPEVKFYASDAPDPSGFGEGQYFLGSTRRPFRIEVPLDLRGKWISATLTDVNTLQIIRGNDNSNVLRTTTSEFSHAVEVPRE
jgi:hypothetical protein